MSEPIKEFSTNDFLVEYNELLSCAALEHKGDFSALASPTLNKQETVTFLYRDVVNRINGKQQISENLNCLRLRLGFVVRLGLMFIRLVMSAGTRNMEESQMALPEIEYC